MSVHRRTFSRLVVLASLLMLPCMTSAQSTTTGTIAGNVKDTTGATPLHEAVRQGKLQMVKDLIAHGADLNARTDRQTGPLSAFRNFEHRTICR